MPVIITMVETRQSTSQFICTLDWPNDFPIIYHHHGHHYYCLNFVECPNISFQNSWYIFTKRGGNWTTDRGICQSQGGDLVSIETEEEWKFINDEIQNRNMSHCNLSDHHCYCCNRWYIGLKKKGENWTWVNRKLLNMSKWAEGRQSRGAVAHICKQSVNGDQGLFYNIHGSRNLAYICEIPKCKTKLLFIFKTELSKRHAKSSRVMRMLSMCSRSVHLPLLSQWNLQRF